MNINFMAPRTWIRVLEQVVLEGEEVAEAKRGEYNSDGTRELLALQSCVDMHFPVMTVKSRGLNYRFMAAEAWWILTGQDEVATIAPYNKIIAKFSDDGVRFFGAYGPRIQEQIEGVLEKLHEDLGTRQAVMTIWRQNPPKSKDIPCTISVQFIVRNGRLHCLDNMRSSDLWLGWPYDVFTFSMLSLGIVIAMRERYGVNLKLGNLWLTAGSQHVYNRDMEKVAACLSSADELVVEKQPFFSPTSFDSIRDLTNYLKDCADGKKSLCDKAE